MGVDPAYNTRHVEPNPEKALALAVIHRAIADLVAPSQYVEPHDQRDAKRFLFARDGQWLASRLAWCELADLDEGALRKRAREIVEGRAQMDLGRKRSRMGPGPSPWYDEVVAFLLAEKHIPGWPSNKKEPLAKILVAAGFKTVSGREVTTDTIAMLMTRKPEAFSWA